jgi:hypothetical protein
MARAKGCLLRTAVALVAALGIGRGSAARAQSALEDGRFLDTVTVIARGVSNMTAASAGDVTAQQLASQPLLRPGAVLESVPGLIVTQHSGEGKANQYFLRAFNLDHGTDLASQIDDMPINMPTHAHGQGYSDLNFLIPELLGELHFKKGPYYADEGDFATAGAIRLGLRNEIDTGATLGAGQDGYRRALLTGSVPLGAGTLLAAAEGYRNDGPFAVPDDYHRGNGMLRYHRGSEQDYWTLTALAYSGAWTATDQVPQRAIDRGLIGRFGSLDPSDGGSTSRASLSFNRVARTATEKIQFSAYAICYRLDLWSTFTYYLSDPVNGDQMLQRDDRVVYGAKASRSWFGQWRGVPVRTVAGLQVRADDIRDVGIFPTLRRQILGTRQRSSVLESSVAAYLESSAQWRRWLRTALALRGDRFDFSVTDRMVNVDGSCNLGSDPLGCDTGRRRAALLSPKLGIVLGPWAGSTVFVNLADGYHSNDARGVTRSGQNAANPAVTPLTRAASAELGLASTPLPGWTTTLDLFELKLRSELAFSGDAGVTAPSGATTRTGIEWGNSYRFSHWLSGDLNAAYSRGRFDRPAPVDDLGCADAAPSHPCAQPVAIAGRHIHNSPTNVVDAGLTAAPGASGWFGSIRARHFGASPLVEDNSARSPAYTTVDLQLGYRHGRDWLVALDVFNLLDARWNDIEYYYVSRLAGEAAASADYVVHAGVPRTLRARFQYTL